MSHSLSWALAQDQGGVRGCSWLSDKGGARGADSYLAGPIWPRAAILSVSVVPLVSALDSWFLRAEFLASSLYELPVGDKKIWFRGRQLYTLFPDSSAQFQCPILRTFPHFLSMPIKAQGRRRRARASFKQEPLFFPLLATSFSLSCGAAAAAPCCVVPRFLRFTRSCLSSGGALTRRPTTGSPPLPPRPRLPQAVRPLPLRLRPAPAPPSCCPLPGRQSRQRGGTGLGSGPAPRSRE